jgi:hypothetical protein
MARKRIADSVLSLGSFFGQAQRGARVAVLGRVCCMPALDSSEEDKRDTDSAARWHTHTSSTDHNDRHGA